MRATGWLRRNADRGRLGRLRRRELGGDDRVAELGDDPVPLRLDQPDARLRLPRLVAGRDVCRADRRDRARPAASILADAFAGSQLWGELFEVPLMSAMFLAMVWHARRRVVALEQVQGVAEVRASLLERQQRFLHDASHELRTPVTIARGHLELFRREAPRRAASSRSRSTSSRGWSGSSRGCCCSRRRSSRSSRSSSRSTSRRSSPTSSCAGPRSRRAPGGSSSTSRGSLRRRPGGAARRARRAARERGQVHDGRRRDRAACPRRGGRHRDRGRRRRDAASLAGGAAAALRPLGARRRCTDATSRAVQGSGSRSSRRSRAPTRGPARSSREQGGTVFALHLPVAPVAAAGPAAAPRLRRGRGDRRRERAGAAVAARPRGRGSAARRRRGDEAERDRLRGVQRLRGRGVAHPEGDSRDRGEGADQREGRAAFTRRSVVVVMPGLCPLGGEITLRKGLGNALRKHIGGRSASTRRAPRAGTRRSRRSAPGPFSATWTAREPTTTPSASAATARACSGVEMPKPA